MRRFSGFRLDSIFCPGKALPVRVSSVGGRFTFFGGRLKGGFRLFSSPRGRVGLHGSNNSLGTLGCGSPLSACPPAAIIVSKGT